MVVTGALTYLSIPKRENPAITVRTAIFAAQFPGITPERVEDLFAVSEDQLVRVFQDIRNKMGDSVGELSEGTRGLSVKTDFGDVAIATIAVTGERFS
jgi:multidrug efflux pump subunit AcrB